MKIMVLESDPKEQSIISEMLEQSSDCDIQYETTVTRAINSLGLAHVDFALVDADYQNCVCGWKELTSFLKSVNIGYSVFSSNGKVGFKNGLQIHSIHDLPNLVEKNLTLLFNPSLLLHHHQDLDVEIDQIQLDLQPSVMAMQNRPHPNRS